MIRAVCVCKNILIFCNWIIFQDSISHSTDVGNHRGRPQVRSFCLNCHLFTFCGDNCIFSMLFATPHWTQCPLSVGWGISACTLSTASRDSTCQRRICSVSHHASAGHSMACISSVPRSMQILPWAPLPSDSSLTCYYPSPTWRPTGAAADAVVWPWIISPRLPLFLWQEFCEASS